jgi:CybS, succinate dehydrogenase cytochrome B small subunit
VALSERSIVLFSFRRQHRFSSSSPYLEGDIGNAGTKIHHTLQRALAIMAPLYFLTPSRYTDGVISKTFGLFLSTSISIHAWIGLNYVCRDYVPKISSKLLGPARIATLGFSVIMFFGMAKISMFSPGGVKGLLLGLWTAPQPPKKEAVVL